MAHAKLPFLKTQLEGLVNSSNDGATTYNKYVALQYYTGSETDPNAPYSAFELSPGGGSPQIVQLDPVDYTLTTGNTIVVEGSGYDTDTPVRTSVEYRMSISVNVENNTTESITFSHWVLLAEDTAPNIVIGYRALPTPVVVPGESALTVDFDVVLKYTENTPLA